MIHSIFLCRGEGIFLIIIMLLDRKILAYKSFRSCSEIFSRSPISGSVTVPDFSYLLLLTFLPRFCHALTLNRDLVVFDLLGALETYNLERRGCGAGGRGCRRRRPHGEGGSREQEEESEEEQEGAGECCTEEGGGDQEAGGGEQEARGGELEVGGGELEEGGGEQEGGGSSRREEEGRVTRSSSK